MAYGENGGIDVQMPVVPAYGGGYGMPFMGGGFGGGLGYGGDGLVWLILIVLLGGGAWGGMGGFGLGGFGGYGIGDINGLYWLNNSQNINDGFRDQMIDSSINQIQNSITSGFGDTQLSICQTGNGITAAVNAGFENAETGANARQMANMQQLFGVQTTLDGHLDNITMALQQCCCDNRAAVADLKYTVATENCEDRAAIKDGLYALTTNNNANTQQILNAIKALDDARCQDKIDAKNERIAELQQQLNFANLQASQTAQNAFIAQTVNGAIDANYQRFKDCPVGTVPVFGNQPIFTCPQSTRFGTGCGCGNGFAN